MERITSFCVDHTKFGVGMYLSRVDGDVNTYDVRMFRPNGGTYLTPASMHTMEHIFATFARNSDIKDKVIYVGPMGCRTGFYVLLRDNTPEEAIELVKQSLEFIRDFEGDIPGATIVECGNYLEQDLETCKKEVLPLIEELRDYTPERLKYPVEN